MKVVVISSSPDTYQNVVCKINKEEHDIKWLKTNDEEDETCRLLRETAKMHPDRIYLDTNEEWLVGYAKAIVPGSKIISPVAIHEADSLIKKLFFRIDTIKDSSEVFGNGASESLVKIFDLIYKYKEE